MKIARSLLLPFALCSLVAACGSDEAPKTADKAAPAAPAPVAAKPVVAQPLRPVADKSGLRELAVEKPGDIAQFSPVGLVECDQFGEKLRLCLNSGAVNPENRQKLYAEYAVGYEQIAAQGTDRVMFCLDLQQKIQPKAIAAGCLNF